MASPYLFEVSWEVANKVGGIYTVIESKAAFIKERFEDRYFLIGPYIKGKSDYQIEYQALPKKFKDLEKKLDEIGLKIRFGTWLIDAKPQVILIEYQNEFNSLDETKRIFWEKYGVDSLNAGFDYDEPLAFSVAAGKVVELLKKEFLPNDEVILQAHEWLSGGAILHLKASGQNISTVFTTHATFLGRVLTSIGVDIYSNTKEINSEDYARRLGIYGKFSLEKASALTTDVLTTVSGITAIEAEAFYGRKPEFILENGLNIGTFPNFEDMAVKHSDFKKILKDYTIYHFFPYYTFDLDETLYYFIIGRYEMQTKGIDVFIDSLGELNKKLKKAKSKKTIVCFFFIPETVLSIKDSLIESKIALNRIKEDIHYEIGEIESQILRSLVGEYPLEIDSVLTQEQKDKFLLDSKKIKKEGAPELVSYNLLGEENDQILRKFKENDLFNREEDRVKTIFYPVYLNGTDGLLNMVVYDCMVGMHLGVFPSLYEPWGYTPLEGAALGISSVTSDLSGFGMAVQRIDGVNKNAGVFVLERRNKNYEESKKSLTDILYQFSKLSKEERIENKINAMKMAENFDWAKMVENYFNAFDASIKRGAK